MSFAVNRYQKIRYDQAASQKLTHTVPYEDHTIGLDLLACSILGTTAENGAQNVTPAVESLYFLFRADVELAFSVLIPAGQLQAIAGSALAAEDRL